MDFVALTAECAPWVAPQTMAAIVRTESQFKPFAININGSAKLERQPRSKEEAIATAKWLLNNNYNIDMGLGQVNSVNLKKTNLSVEDAFDPCKNLAASATILQWNYESASKKIPDQQAALKAAISAYNTGSFTRGFNNGYVQKVVANAGYGNVVPISLKAPSAVAVSEAKTNASKPALPSNGVIDAPGSISNAEIVKSTLPTQQYIEDKQGSSEYDVMIFK